jgi:hypothetical protein
MNLAPSAPTDFESTKTILLWFGAVVLLAGLTALVGTVIFFLRVMRDERVRWTNLLVLLGVALLSAVPGMVVLHLTRSWSGGWHALCLLAVIVCAAASPGLFVRHGWRLGRGRLAKGRE